MIAPSGNEETRLAAELDECRKEEFTEQQRVATATRTMRNDAFNKLVDVLRTVRGRCLGIRVRLAEIRSANRDAI